MQQQQQLGSEGEVSGAEGEGLCVCECLLLSRLCGGGTAGARRRLNLRPRGVALSPVPPRGSPSPLFPRDTDICHGDM